MDDTIRLDEVGYSAYRESISIGVPHSPLRECSDVTQVAWKTVAQAIAQRMISDLKEVMEPEALFLLEEKWGLTE